MNRSGHCLSVDCGMRNNCKVSPDLLPEFRSLVLQATQCGHQREAPPPQRFAFLIPIRHPRFSCRNFTARPEWSGIGKASERRGERERERERAKVVKSARSSVAVRIFCVTDPYVPRSICSRSEFPVDCIGLVLDSNCSCWCSFGRALGTCRGDY